MIAQCSNSLQSTNYQLVRGNKRYSCYYWEMLVNKKTNCSVHDCKLLCHNFITQHLISIFPIIFGPLYNSTEKEEQRKCNESKLCFCPCVPLPLSTPQIIIFHCKKLSFTRIQFQAWEVYSVTSTTYPLFMCKPQK